MSNYDHSIIESKWQSIWDTHQTYFTDTNLLDRPKWYNLVMFPYPSGDLHIGHWYNFAPADVIARFKRMQGFNVLNPFGFDAFGLPAENAAIKRGIHPSDWTRQNIQNMIKQLKSMGPSYDWSKVIDTSDPDYYKWTQWCFLQLYKHQIAYKKKATANWCPNCKSVLANEQAENGVCWRCGYPVEQRMIDQWFLRITDYAHELQEMVDRLDWPEKIKLMQKNWIGKSNGSRILFPLQNSDANIEVFSTRPDTIMGATFLVLAPEHALVDTLTTPGQKREIELYKEQTKRKTEFQRISQKEHKTGAFTGSYVRHPLSSELLPVWISDFVLPTYAQGAVMGVPGHDHRDYEFAKTHDLPIKIVVQPSEVTSLILNKSLSEQALSQLQSDPDFIVSSFSTWGTLVYFNADRYDKYEKIIVENLHEGPWSVHTDGLVRKVIFKDRIIAADSDGSWTTARTYGLSLKIIPESLDFSFPEEGYSGPVITKDHAYLVNSGKFSGLSSDLASQAIVKALQQLNLGRTEEVFRLRDWLISRQRYWGPPVPIIYCDRCGTVPVPESELPVVLPYNVDYTPQETSALGSSPEFVKTNCPICNQDARRDTDTLDTFVDSSWYFLRFVDPHNTQQAFPTQVAHWLPVDKYIGGAEHAVLHLLYARFFVKAFRDLGYLNFDEPFQALYNQGTILGPDHQKMSKSKGNVINPDELVTHYGADAVRVYLCFLGPYDQGGPWNPSGIEGASRFVRRIHNLLLQDSENSTMDSLQVNRLLHKLIKKITEDLHAMKFNTAIAAFMEFTNSIQGAVLDSSQKTTLLKLLAPFCPHLTEEHWHLLTQNPDQKSIHFEKWPEYDPNLLVEQEVQIVIQINSKVKGHLLVPHNQTEDQVLQLALTLDKIRRSLPENRKIVRTVYVPDKILNIITT